MTGAPKVGGFVAFSFPFNDKDESAVEDEGLGIGALEAGAAEVGLGANGLVAGSVRVDFGANILVEDVAGFDENRLGVEIVDDDAFAAEGIAESLVEVESVILWPNRFEA